MPLNKETKPNKLELVNYIKKNKVLANGPGDWVQSQVKSYQRL